MFLVFQINTKGQVRTMVNRNIHKLIVFALIMLVCTSGCTISKYTNKSFKSQEIDRIVVLPFMDNRKDPDPKINFEKMVSDARRTLVGNLKYSKKYRAILCGDIGNVSSYSVHDLPSRDLSSRNYESRYAYSIDPESVDHEWIKQLGPSSERWILVPVIESSSDIRISGAGGSSLYLFDKQNGELWWHHNFKTRVTIPPMLWPILPLIEKDALARGCVIGAIRACINELPVREGPYLLPD